MTWLTRVDNFANQKNDMERNIIETEGYTIVETDSCSLEEIVEFVVKENYLHHLKRLPENISKEIEELITEEKRLLSTSKFFVARDNDNRLIGCIRLHLWNHNLDLPISKFLGSSETSTSQDEISTVWHIGRFAVKHFDHKVDISLFKALMICAISPIIQMPDSIMLAETDIKLLSSLKCMGIYLKALAFPQYYLGSLTIPSYAKSRDLQPFYERNSSILTPSNILTKNF